MSQTITPCKECGCICRYCNDHGGLHLHVEIENLKQRLLERENHIVKMETNFLKEAEKFPNGEVAAISEELLTWQDKYSRLYEAHKRVQKVNQNLEDKLLRIVDKCETEKSALTTEVSNLTRRLVDEKFSVSRLQEENERYRNDVNLAIQLLQCKPSNFVSQKYESLPGDLQLKVRTYLSSKKKHTEGNGNTPIKPEVKTIKVPIPTYPPTAMVYSVNKTTIDKDAEDKSSSQNSGVDIVSAAIMAKVLEEREKERSQMKHCETCTCQSGSNPTCRNQSTQTLDQSNKSTKNVSNSTNNRVAFSSALNVKTNGRSNSKGEKKEWISDVDSGKCTDVTEAILVDLSSPVDSPISSANSEISTLSWASKTDSLNPQVCEANEVNSLSWSNKQEQQSPIKISDNATWTSKEIAIDLSPINHTPDNISWSNKVDIHHSPHAQNNNPNDSPTVWNSGKTINSSNSTVDSSSWSGKDDVHITTVHQNTSNNNNVDAVSWNTKLDVQPVSNATSEITNSHVQDLISFEKQQSNASKGPRHCSVRVQLGTNNILLDNVVHPFTPVLYRGRGDLAGSHYESPRGRFESRSARYDPSVHTSSPRSTSTSSNSSSDAEPPLTHRKNTFRTETEI